MLECDELTDQFKVKYDDRLDGGILEEQKDVQHLDIASGLFRLCSS